MEYRISKYDPKYRKPDGTYGRHEWTSFSDIGKEFENKQLDYESYLQAEDGYVDAVVAFFQVARVNRLVIDEVEVSSELQSIAKSLDYEPSLLPELKVGATVHEDTFPAIVRLSLREGVWCKLSGDSRAYLHFGYDYYVYVGSDAINESDWSLPTGIYAEPHASPYFTV